MCIVKDRSSTHCEYTEHMESCQWTESMEYGTLTWTFLCKEQKTIGVVDDAGNVIALSAWRREGAPLKG